MNQHKFKLLGARMDIKELDSRVFEIFKHLPVAFAIFDNQMNYITYSHQWVKDYQLNEDEDLTGKNHYDVFPEIPQHWRELHQRCLKGEHLFNNAEKFVRADGSVQYDAWDIRPWFIQNKIIGGMIATTKNVTSEVILSETEKKLVQSNYFLKTAQRVAKIGHWVLNHNDKTIEWSDQTYRIFDVDKEKFTPSYEAFLNAIHPDDLEMVNQVFLESLKSKKNYSVEHRIKLKDGGIKYVFENGFTKYSENGDAIFSQGTIQDVTESKKMERKIQRYLDMIDKNIISSSMGLDGVIVEASKAFCDISGYSKEELIGKTHDIVRHPDFPNKHYKELWETISKDKEWKGEIKNRRKDGTTYWVYAIISATYDDNGKKIGYTAIRQDITDKKTLEEISITDGLTGLFNRRHFNALFPKIINAAKRENELVSFIIIDIDHFKLYNDTYGHQEGDYALINVAAAIKNSLNRASDYSFRLGGEEFGVLFKAKSKENAISFAKTIRENIENLHIEHKENSASPFVTASLGLICLRAKEIKSENEVYKEADDQLYKAKLQGRNQLVSSSSIKRGYKQYIYASKAHPEDILPDIVEIVKTASKNNNIQGVTGFLVFNGNYFLQVIEGRPDQVDQLMNNILADKRHFEVKVIGKKIVNNRDFKDWAIGYMNDKEAILAKTFELTGEKKFMPYDYSYDTSLSLLKELAKLAI